MVALFGAKTTKNSSKETARRLLTCAAFSSWGWKILPEMARTPTGKPYFPAFPTYQFNLSHSGAYALCALSQQGSVGVDIELVRPHRAELPAYVMEDWELAAFDGTWEDFTRIWTLKEAHAKCLGRAIFPPKSISSVPPMAYASYAGAGWRAALCSTAEDLPSSIHWETL